MNVEAPDDTHDRKRRRVEYSRNAFDRILEDARGLSLEQARILLDTVQEVIVQYEAELMERMFASQEKGIEAVGTLSWYTQLLVHPVGAVQSNCRTGAFQSIHLEPALSWHILVG